MTVSTQRLVLVTRHTWFEQLLRRHGTRQQASFFLSSREQSLEPLEAQHHEFEAALQGTLASIPASWRRTRIDRSDLDRFLFEPSDIVVVLGQDGLVANVSKYLTDQPVIGVNPSPAYYDGVLVRHAVDEVRTLLPAVAARESPMLGRTKVHVALDDGLSLTALNELFFGHVSHQSARYVIQSDRGIEMQSSSGVIVATGTGSTGWARSIHQQVASPLILPHPAEPRLVHFTREAWPSRTTGTTVTSGELRPGESLRLESRMEEGGIVFGDGMEADRLEFSWGRVATVSIAETTLWMPRVPADDVVDGMFSPMTRRASKREATRIGNANLHAGSRRLRSPPVSGNRRDFCLPTDRKGQA